MPRDALERRADDLVQYAEAPNHKRARLYSKDLVMKSLVAFLLVSLLTVAPASASQIPPEWQSAAQAVIGELERATPQAARPWGNELHGRVEPGAPLAPLQQPQQRDHPGGISHLRGVLPPGLAGHTIEGLGYRAAAEKMKALRLEHGGPYALAANAHDWLASLPDPTGAARKNADLWGKDLDTAAADFATGNLYGLAWLLARAQPTPAEQAATFARFAIFVQGRAWIGTRCLDITKVAAVLDAPPRIEVCK